jgi:transcriptional regulator with XRE-family HTH domain
VQEDLAIAFGQVIRQKRDERGWSQEKLAERSERSRNLIARFEQGRSQPSLESLWDLARALGTRPHELIELADEQLKRNRRSRAPVRRNPPGRRRNSR